MSFIEDTGAWARSYDLPWPPSVNRYWRHVVIHRSVRVILSRAGRQYRKDAVAAIGHHEEAMTGRLRVQIDVMPPDRRARDLDNLAKAVLDALTHAGVWEDDSQIDALSVRRLSPVRGGLVRVSVSPLGGSRD